MGRIGSSYDALAESFFATLKRELDVDHRHWTTEPDARRDVFRWIAFYNHRRVRHEAPNHRVEVRDLHRLAVAAAG